MRFHSFLITGFLMLGNSTAALASGDTVNGTLTGIDCSGDYCQLHYTVDSKPQKAVCADEVYCEQWADQEKLPASILNKVAKLQVKREKT